MTSLGTIHGVICEYYDMEPLKVFECTMRAEVIYPRQCFHYLSRKMNPQYRVSLRTIGEYFSDVSGVKYAHSTVYHNSRKIEDYMQIYKDVRNDIDKLTTIINELK